MNIIGRLTKDASLHTLGNGRQVVNFSIAVSEQYHGKEGQSIQRTEYFDCAYWISPGVAAILTKGALVELTGFVSARAWVRKDGEAVAGLKFHTSRIKLHQGGKKQQAALDTARHPATADINSQEDLPF
ncbi:single-stranded DNA-binding protein [Emticicia sp. TH156]|uniref:single-stranded DNA-binding protein n=1 Tax=Emticicia sp. TH156 TaxID=2067454 RepID=UPI000C75EEBD|nr:single-stranded DNA-binding protein [Emticicia sp. TH156]PLK45273.1 single-stranded DNA-binding protein [Emticicia sp. TH156]